MVMPLVSDTEKHTSISDEYVMKQEISAVLVVIM